MLFYHCERTDDGDFDANVIEVSFDADEDRDSPVNNREVDIPLENDSTDENLHQYFFAHLEVVDAVEEIDHSANNVAKCTIVDDDEGTHSL